MFFFFQICMGTRMLAETQMFCKRSTGRQNAFTESKIYTFFFCCLVHLSVLFRMIGEIKVSRDDD